MPIHLAASKAKVALDAHRQDNILSQLAAQFKMSGRTQWNSISLFPFFGGMPRSGGVVIEQKSKRIDVFINR